MKYLVTVPLIGYAEYTVEVDDDMSLEDVRHGVAMGDIDLDPVGKYPIKEYTLIEDLDNFNVPSDWPHSFEVEPY